MGHKIANVPLILKIWEIIFVFGQITLWAIFSGYFEGASTFLPLTLEGQNVLAPSKYPSKWPIK
jgi:hypothetical protein